MLCSGMYHGMLFAGNLMSETFVIYGYKNKRSTQEKEVETTHCNKRDLRREIEWNLCGTTAPAKTHIINLFSTEFAMVNYY